MADRSRRSPEASPTAGDHDRQRRLSAALTLVVATSLLAGTLRAPAGSRSFFLFGLAAAAAWILGAVVSGPIPWRPPHRRARHDVVPAVALAALAFLGFLAADLVGRHLPPISGALHRVLSRADRGPVAIVLAVALVNGLGEELFFRGALFAALERHRPALSSTLVYVAVTAATGNLALMVAAGAMGTLFALQRAHTRSVLASTITHLCWSTLMLFVLPR